MSYDSSLSCWAQLVFFPMPLDRAGIDPLLRLSEDPLPSLWDELGLSPSLCALDELWCIHQFQQAAMNGLSLWSLPGHTVVLHASARSLRSQTCLAPPWPHQEGNEGRMLLSASQPGFGSALAGWLEPVLSRLAPAAQLRV